MNITDATEVELVLELVRRYKEKGIYLHSDANNKVIEALLKNNELDFNFALTFGEPNTLSHEKFKCSRCHELKSENHFTFYLSRIDSDGYLMRSNAICDDCRKTSNKKRDKTLKEAHNNGEIPEAPKSGDTCPHCERKWYGNWHRHHDDINHKFINWLCGNCNMSFHDQRTPKQK